MLGLFRTTLALMVMAYHLFAELKPLGTYSVYGFYIISGYLMTLIMHESYGYTLFGRFSFALNRFLRLYPQYWVASIFSAGLVFYLGAETTTHYFKSIYMPTSAREYFSNIAMIFPSWYPNQVNPRLVPPAWALTVELFFYVLICLGLSKHYTVIKVWLLLSVAYVVATFAFGSWSDRYFPVAAASLPFSIGSAIYFISKDEGIHKRFLTLGLSTKTLFILMLANCFAWSAISLLTTGALVEIGFYLNLLICALLVYSITKCGKIVDISKAHDTYIGDFSYPIYLLHWQTGILVSFVIYGEAVHGFSTKGGVSYIVSLLVISLLAVVFMAIIDRPIQRIRSIIKANKALAKTRATAN
ncbi:MAG: acyltransferase [Methyloglobulus sp.]|nr:acyltransferase [Methyloglobulus sp.]